MVDSGWLNLVPQSEGDDICAKELALSRAYLKNSETKQMLNVYRNSNIMRQGTALKWLSLVFWACLTMPLLGLAEELSPPQRVIKQTAEQLIGVLERDREKLQSDPQYVFQLANKILVPRVDMSRVSRLALGKHWRRATKVQRQRFTTEFRRLLVRTYSTAMKQFRGEANIRFLPVQTKAGSNNVVVSTKMSHAGTRSVSVDYRMHKKDGHWLAYDVKIEGVSLVTNYRSSFTRQIRQGGMDELIRQISKRNQHLVHGTDPLVAKNGPS